MLIFFIVLSFAIVAFTFMLSDGDRVVKSIGALVILAQIWAAGAIVFVIIHFVIKYW